MRESRTLRAIVAGAGNGLTVRLVRHSHRKRGETDRPRLRSTAPALDPTASQLWRKVSMLLGMLARMDGFLSSQGRAGLTPRDRELLAPRFERLHRDATSVATLSRDFISELART